MPGSNDVTVIKDVMNGSTQWRSIQRIFCRLFLKKEAEDIGFAIPTNKRPFMEQFRINHFC